MNWQLLGPLLVTAAVTILGWFAAHQLTAWRDRINKRREQRIEYLIGAFRSLAKVTQQELHTVYDEFESAVTDIGLFGSAEQIHRLDNALDQIEVNPSFRTHI